VNFRNFRVNPYCSLFIVHCSLSIPLLLYMTTKVCRHLGRACRQLANSKVLTECPSYTPTRRGLTTAAPLRPRLRSIRSFPSKRGYHYYTNAEKEHERIITTSIGRIEEFEKASKALSEGSGVQEAIELSKTLKDLGPLKNTWDEYLVLREVCPPHLRLSAGN
jgi:hypothetical protein